MDIKIEEMLEKLRQVKNNANKDLEGKEEYKNSVAQNVTYYGTIELVNKVNKEVEQHELYTVEIYNYETEETSQKIYLDGQEIDAIELMRTYEDISPIKDKINEAKERSKQDRKQKPEDRSYSLNELEEEKKEEEKEEEKDDEKTLDEEEVKDLQISNAQGKIDLDQMVDGRTLRNIMGLDADYKYIAPVSSSSLNLEGTNASYTFVALKEDGTAKVLYDDVISEDRQEGIATADKDKFVGNDGKVEQKSAISNYVITGTRYSLSVHYDEGTSSRATTITKRSGRENTKGEIDKELHHQGDLKIDSDSRDSLREINGIGSSDDMKKRPEEQENEEGENDRVENIDDDKTNDLHYHITDEQLEELAEITGENKDKLRERFDREVVKNPNKNPEQIIEEIEDDYEMLRNHNHEQ